ncbi:MAG: glycogen/starch synthase, partial [Pseudomonadota bacterium]|nr:glycogen/starch synthase [Pseudomonadota bacterium]
MKVLYVSSEIYPLAKTGGLGDVAAALPCALRDSGVDIRLMMPAYRGTVDRMGRIERADDLGAVLNARVAQRARQRGSHIAQT